MAEYGSWNTVAGDDGSLKTKPKNEYPITVHKSSIFNLQSKITFSLFLFPYSFFYNSTTRPEPILNSKFLILNSKSFPFPDLPFSIFHLARRSAALRYKILRSTPNFTQDDIRYYFCNKTIFEEILHYSFYIIHY